MKQRLYGLLMRLYSSLHSRRNVFERIHKKNAWESEESASGLASELHHTEALRKQLPDLLKQLGVRTLLDAPCGDFNWMRETELNLDHYWGVDIVDTLIDQNRRYYGNENRTFLLLDLVTAELPTVDLILCRDCLVHLSLRDGQRALNNFRRTGSRFLLATTFPNTTKNRDIVTGGWRPLNLALQPFSLGEPRKLVDENCQLLNGRYADKSLGLWNLNEPAE